jgi:hypothetical protein
MRGNVLDLAIAVIIGAAFDTNCEVACHLHNIAGVVYGLQADGRFLRYSGLAGHRPRVRPHALGHESRVAVNEDGVSQRRSVLRRGLPFGTGPQRPNSTESAPR